MTNCLADHDIRLDEYREDGSYEAYVGELDGALANVRMGKCEETSGEAWIGRLYRSQTSNPTNIPEAQLLVECLIRSRAVPDTYTVEQYDLDAPEMAFPYIDPDGAALFVQCNADSSYIR